MLLSPEYCQVMARYNRWQNNQLKEIFSQMGEEALRVDRGGFFGSILATANHVLWADKIWLARLAGTAGPGGSIAESPEFTKRLADWDMQRFRVDAEILIWAEALSALDLSGALVWHSGSTGQEQSKPKAFCALHMFNHQTHHRGQIHAMITAAGFEAPLTDLPFGPDLM